MLLDRFMNPLRVILDDVEDVTDGEGEGSLLLSEDEHFFLVMLLFLLLLPLML